MPKFIILQKKKLKFYSHYQFKILINFIIQIKFNKKKTLKTIMEIYI